MGPLSAESWRYRPEPDRRDGRGRGRRGPARAGRRSARARAGGPLCEGTGARARERSPTRAAARVRRHGRGRSRARERLFRGGGLVAANRCSQRLFELTDEPGGRDRPRRGGLARGRRPEVRHRSRHAGGQVRPAPTAFLLAHAGGDAGLFSMIFCTWAAGEIGSQPVTRSVHPSAFLESALSCAAVLSLTIATAAARADPPTAPGPFVVVFPIGRVRPCYPPGHLLPSRSTGHRIFRRFLTNSTARRTRSSTSSSAIQPCRIRIISTQSFEQRNCTSRPMGSGSGTRSAPIRIPPPADGGRSEASCRTD